MELRLSLQLGLHSLQLGLDLAALDLAGLAGSGFQASGFQASQSLLWLDWCHLCQQPQQQQHHCS